MMETLIRFNVNFQRKTCQLNKNMISIPNKRLLECLLIGEIPSNKTINSNFEVKCLYNIPTH